MVLSWKERMYKMRAGPHPQSRASTSPWAPPHRWPLPPWGLPACSPHWQGPSLRCRGNTTFPMAVSGMLRANKLGEQRLPKASGHHLAPSRLLALSGRSVLPSQQQSAAVWVFWCDYIPGVLLSTSHQSKTTRTPNCALADYSDFAKRVRGRNLCVMISQATWSRAIQGCFHGNWNATLKASGSYIWINVSNTY